MPTQPWASGPQELLQHGLSLLESDSDRNRRLALIAIDNSVELMMKTFLGLPRRVTGLTITRKDFSDASESFPKLLDAMETHAQEKLVGVDLGELEWFHRLRNELYHQGNGLTVARTNVEVYAELARVLFQNLFGFGVGERDEHDSQAHRLLGEFLSAWVEIEKLVVKLVVSNPDIEQGARHTPIVAIRALVGGGIIPTGVAAELDELRQLRNAVVHAQVDNRDALSLETVKRARGLRAKLSALSAS
jgi:hypothetical protein